MKIINNFGKKIFYSLRDRDTIIASGYIQPKEVLEYYPKAVITDGFPKQYHLYVQPCEPDKGVSGGNISEAVKYSIRGDSTVTFTTTIEPGIFSP